jgi:hypothetical protein
MSTKIPLTYWQGCFPEHMKFSFGYEDTLLWAASHMEERAHPRADKCVIEIRRVSPKQHARLKKKLRAIVHTDGGGKWNTGDFNFVAYLWELPRHGGPVAFMTFRVAVSERTRSGRIDWVTFEPDLAYVLKAKRRRDLGKMLAAAFEPWLSQCRAYGPRVKRGGVNVLFFAEYHSEGGGQIGEILFTHFQLIKERKMDCPVHTLGWDIRETDYDAGF